MTFAFSLALALTVIGAASWVYGINPVREASHFLSMRRGDVMQWWLERRYWISRSAFWLRRDVAFSVRMVAWEWLSLPRLVLGSVPAMVRILWDVARDTVREASENTRAYVKHSTSHRPRFRSPEWNLMVQQQTEEYRHANNIWKNGRPPRKPDAYTPPWDEN